jgi:prepilin-type N-terminal cleavage/methylation domain-containing protein
MRNVKREDIGSPSAVIRQAGFTLVEVLLAAALSALLLTIVYSTFFSINRSIDAATENQEAFETGRVLSELIKRDIRGIRGGRFPLIAKNEDVEAVPVGRIEFVTAVRVATERVLLRRVGYVLVIGDRSRTILLRKESENLTEPLDNSAKTFELSRIINRFQLELYNGTEWVKDWDSVAAGSFPKQIRVIFDVVDTKGKSRTFTAEETIQSAG